MENKAMLFPTTLVGSYPQPEWLIDRKKLAGRFPPRVRARELYSNRFATALEGVDIDNPGSALDRSGHPNPVPRVVGKIRRKHPVEVQDLLFLKKHTKKPV